MKIGTLGAAFGLVVATGRHGSAEANDMGASMDDEHGSEERQVEEPTKARQGEVSRGAPVRWVLVVSTVAAALALLIIYLLFVRA